MILENRLKKRKKKEKLRLKLKDKRLMRRKRN